MGSEDEALQAARERKLASIRSSVETLAALRAARLRAAEMHASYDVTRSRIDALELYRDSYRDTANPFLHGRSLSPDDLIEKAKRRYVSGDIEIDAFEDAVGRALGLT